MCRRAPDARTRASTARRDAAPETGEKLTSDVRALVEKIGGTL